MERGRGESVPRIEHHRLIANLTRSFLIKFVAKQRLLSIFTGYFPQKRVWRKSGGSRRKCYFTFFTAVVKLNKSPHHTFPFIFKTKEVCICREKVEKARRQSVPRIEHNRLIANLTRPFPIKFVPKKTIIYFHMLI